MKKNVASQKVGVQMLTAADGSAFTGTVTVYVTGDAGTQAIGSVSSGVCTHEGNGYHTYSPAQAETNYDLIAFTFIGTGAAPVTVQVFTNFPQTGDNYAIVSSGTSGNAALKTLIDTLTTYVDTEVAAIKAKTDLIPTDPADASDIAASFSTVNATLATIAGYLDTEIAAIKAKTDNLPSDPADASDIATAFGTVNTTLSTIAGYLDTEIAAIKAKTDNLPASPSSSGDITTAVSALATAANLAAVKSVVDAIKIITDALTAAAATKLAKSAGEIYTGTVDSTVIPTTTVFEADDITEATADHYNGRVIIFTSGNLKGQATSISDYTLASGKGRFTVVQMTEAPANNDEFIIV